LSGQKYLQHIKSRSSFSH